MKTKINEYLKVGSGDIRLIANGDSIDELLKSAQIIVFTGAKYSLSEAQVFIMMTANLLIHERYNQDRGSFRKLIQEALNRGGLAEASDKVIDQRIDDVYERVVEFLVEDLVRGSRRCVGCDRDVIKGAEHDQTECLQERNKESA